MTSSSPSPVRRNYTTGEMPLCSYCRAPLDPFYYFCRRCATPYKPVVTLTGTVQPAPLGDAERIQKMAPQAWTLFWTFAAVVIAAALVSLPWMTRENAWAFYFISTLAVLVTALIFGAVHWRPLAAQLRTSGFFKWEAWAGLAALIPLLLLNFGYHFMLRQISGFHQLALAPDLPLPLGVIIICVFPAIAEEIAFRGLLQYWLDISIAPTKALVLGSAMFAALHFSLLSFPYLFLVGMLLAVVRRRTGSLYPCMLIHFLHNLAVITLFAL